MACRRGPRPGIRGVKSQHHRQTGVQNQTLSFISPRPLLTSDPVQYGPPKEADGGGTRGRLLSGEEGRSFYFIHPHERGRLQIDISGVS